MGHRGTHAYTQSLPPQRQSHSLSRVKLGPKDWSESLTDRASIVRTMEGRNADNS